MAKDKTNAGCFNSIEPIALEPPQATTWNQALYQNQFMSASYKKSCKTTEQNNRTINVRTSEKTCSEKLEYYNIK